MKTFFSLMLPVLLAGTCFGQYANGYAGGRGSGSGATQAQGGRSGHAGAAHPGVAGSRGAGMSTQQVRPSIGAHAPMYSTGIGQTYRAGTGGLAYNGRPYTGLPYSGRPVTAGVYAGNRGTYYGTSGHIYGAQRGTTGYGSYGAYGAIRPTTGYGSYSATRTFGDRIAGSRYYNGSPSGNFNHGDFRHAPGDVSRGWDHHHDYAWNHHHYCWNGSNWNILYADPYYYTYDGPIGYDGYAAGGYAAEDAGAVYDTVPEPSYPRRVIVDSDVNADSLAVDVQRALARAGYYNGTIDGIIGPETRNAIVNYQTDRGIPASGRITGSLVRELGL